MGLIDWYERKKHKLRRRSLSYLWLSVRRREGAKKGLANSAVKFCAVSPSLPRKEMTNKSCVPFFSFGLGSFFFYPSRKLEGISNPKKQKVAEISILNPFFLFVLLLNMTGYSLYPSKCPSLTRHEMADWLGRVRLYALCRAAAHHKHSRVE